MLKYATLAFEHSFLTMHAPLMDEEAENDEEEEC